MQDKNQNSNTAQKTPTTSTAQGPKQPTQSPEEMSAMWSSRYDIAKTYQQPMFQKWGKWYDDMYGHLQTTGTAALWRSKVYMPIIASKVWDLISRFVQYRPGWEVSIRSLPVNTLNEEAFNMYMDEMSQRVDKVKWKLDYDYDNPLMEDSIPDELLGVMLDACVTGQGLGRVPWQQKTSNFKSHVNQSGMLNFGQQQLITATEGYNSFNAINIFKVFLTPGAESLQKSPWMIIHDFVPLYTLQSDPKYTNLDQVKAGTITDDTATYQQSRNRLVNSSDAKSLDTTTQMVEIFECWDKQTNQCLVYAIGQSGWVLIYQGDNVYWHQKYPFVSFYIRRKPYQFWGESLFENSETLQAAVNDIFNHFMDAYNMGDGMIAIEEGSVVEPYTVEPGGEIRYRGDMPKQFKFPQPDAQGMQMATNMVNSAIESATISQYASGVPNSENDNTQGTATGVTRIMEAAAEKVGFMRSNFRRSWREVGEMWTSNTQQFMRTDVIYQRVANGQKINEVLKPIDMIGLFGVRIDDGSFEPVSKDQKRQDYLQYVTNLKAWEDASVEQAQRTGDPSDAIRINWNQVAQRGSEQFSENFGQFSLPAVAPQQPNAQAGQTAPVNPAVQAAQPMSAEEAYAGSPQGGSADLSGLQIPQGVA